jgi:CO/xanthine dehydrogenase Mo-binding subunit
LSPPNAIGKSATRVEGEIKVTGKAVYALDVTVPEMLWVKILRSPLPYAQIKQIDVTEAQRLPGVKAIITGMDVHGRRIGRRIYDMPILAEDVVRFAGEKVAAVAAETEAIAEEALNLIRVEYEQFTPLLDPLESLKPSAVLIHPDVLSYKGLPHPLTSASNVFVTVTSAKGNIEEGFREADVIVENTFETQPVHQSYLEPHSCVVRVGKLGTAEIWACSKVPFALREQVASAVGVCVDQLVVHPCYIGGDFGGKGDFMDVGIAYFLSEKSRRPVKIVMGYDEEFAAGDPRHGAIIKVKTGVKKDGSIVAHHMDFIFDSGAYGAFKPRGFLPGTPESAGPYRMANVLIEEKCVYTNKIPCGHMRAPGDAQGFFANESQMDLVANRIGMSPLQFRLKNLMRSGDISPTGHVLEYIEAARTLTKAIELSRYSERKPKYVGRGMSLVHWHTMGGECAVSVTADRQGVVTVASTVLDQGSGTYTIMQQIVAEELQLPVNKILVRTLDTTTSPPDTGVGGSRATRVYGLATYDAVLKTKKQIQNIAAAKLQCQPDEIKFFHGRVYNAQNTAGIDLNELLAGMESDICVQSLYNSVDKGSVVSICAQVAEVHVDPETGQITVTNFTTAHDTGTILNPLTHQGQIDGGVIMGLGYALIEQLLIEDGKVMTLNFGDSKIPNIRDIPALKTTVRENRRGLGPYSSMSIGETPLIPVAAAIANAVEDAIGARVKSLPLTAEKVLQVLRNQD